MLPKQKALLLLVPVIAVLLVIWLLLPKYDFQPSPLKLSYANSQTKQFNSSLIFAPVDSNLVNLKEGGKQNYHWIRLDFSESDLKNLRHPAIIVKPHELDYVALYKNPISDNKPLIEQTTFEYSSNRVATSQQYIFDIDTLKKEKQLYLLIQEKNQYSAPIELWELQYFLSGDFQKNSFLSAIFFGIFLMIIINSLFYINIKDKAYLYYILYHSTMMFFLLIITGVAFHYPALKVFTDSNMKGLGWMLITSFFFATFTRHFLSTKIITPILDKVITGYQIIYASLLTGLLVLPSFSEIYRSTANVTSLSSMLFYLVLMTRQIYLKHRSAYFFAIAFCIPVLIAMTRFLYIWDLLPFSFFIAYGTSIAVMIEAILFSIGLADKVLQLKMQRDEANIQNLKTNYMLSLEKDLNHSVSEITNHLESDKHQENYKQFIVESFFEAFKKKLNLKSNAIIYKKSSETKFIFDNKHQDRYHVEFVGANIDKIEKIALGNSPKKLLAKQTEFLIVPSKLRNHEWCAVLFEVNESFETNSMIETFLGTYSSELIRCILQAEHLEGIKEQAETDALTGLLNRRAIINFLEHEMSKPYNETTAFSLAFIDCDNFKAINDKYGHETGDQCLVNLSDALNKNLPKSAIIGRYGGDEFIVLLPNSNQFQSLNNFNKLKNKLLPVFSGENLINFTISVGIATRSKTTKSYKEVLKQADKALYQSKDNGKNNISVAS